MIEYEGEQLDETLWIGTSRAAEIAQRNRRTVLKWCQGGLIPSRQMPGPRGQYQIRVGDLIAALTKPGYQAPATVDVEA